MFLQKESLRKTQDKTDALYLKCFSIIQNICTNEKYSSTQNRLHFKVFHPRKITKKMRIIQIMKLSTPMEQKHN